MVLPCLYINTALFDGSGTENPEASFEQFEFGI